MSFREEMEIKDFTSSPGNYCKIYSVSQKKAINTHGCSLGLQKSMAKLASIQVSVISQGAKGI